MERAPSRAVNEDTEAAEEPENEPTLRVILHLLLFLLTVGEGEKEIERAIRKEMESSSHYYTLL